MKKIHSFGCKCGYDGDEDLEKKNPWWVQSSDYYNCFWNYIKENDRPHTLNEIANLLGLSISAITTIERKALEKLKKKVKTLQKNK